MIDKYDLKPFICDYDLYSAYYHIERMLFFKFVNWLVFKEGYPQNFATPALFRQGPLIVKLIFTVECNVEDIIYTGALK